MVVAVCSIMFKYLYPWGQVPNLTQKPQEYTAPSAEPVEVYGLSSSQAQLLLSMIKCALKKQDSPWACTDNVQIIRHVLS